MLPSLGGTMRDVRLIGDAPEVKILGEVLPDEPLSSTKPIPASHHRPLAPPPRPPTRGWYTSVTN